MKYVLLALVLLGNMAWTKPVFAFEPVSDCVIREFASDITLRTDSSLAIQEDIRVDCGTLERHGIFRILPTWAPGRQKEEFAKTRINLVSITNDKDVPWRYTTMTEGMDGTLTWKIGDPDVLISGIDHYRIKYTVQNAVTLRGGLHQLYWNINGNFWELPSDKVTGRIHLPEGITKDNAKVAQFVGSFGSTSSVGAEVKWADAQTLEVTGKRPLNVSEGITVQVDFPTNVVALYQPTWWDSYGWTVPPVVSLLVVIWMFFWAYRLWRKHGKELPVRHPVTAEFEPPKGIGPLEAVLFSEPATASVGRPISATIVDLAIRGWIKIVEEEKTSPFQKKPLFLELLKTETSGLRDYELKIMKGLFGSDWSVGQKVEIEDQKNKFYTTVNAVTGDVKKGFETKGWYDPASAKVAQGMIIRAILLFVLAFGLSWLTVWAIPVGIAGGIIILIFGILTSRRTAEGAEMFRLIKGFRLYMSRAEKYRMQFYEKENIFEKYLPYAMAFGLTALWVKAFQKIYGQEAVRSYVPVWYAGSHMGSFDVNSFQSRLNSLSSQIGSTLTSSPSSSGGSGGGFSGGGGGGGGGGSW